MKPVVNLEEIPGKTVGDISRRSPAQTLDYLVRQFHAMDAMGLKLPYPKGVYKFRTLDEANEWDWNHIMKAAKKKSQDHRSSPTSAGSLPCFEPGSANYDHVS